MSYFLPIHYGEELPSVSGYATPEKTGKSLYDTSWNDGSVPEEDVMLSQLRIGAPEVKDNKLHFPQIDTSEIHHAHFE